MLAARVRACGCRCVVFEVCRTADDYEDDRTGRLQTRLGRLAMSSSLIRVGMATSSL